MEAQTIQVIDIDLTVPVELVDEDNSTPILNTHLSAINTALDNLERTIEKLSPVINSDIVGSLEVDLEVLRRNLK